MKGNTVLRYLYPKSKTNMIQINESKFLERYNALNDRQKEAVDTIYGAVMVVAGPGTGKTEVLAIRIANLLRSDAQVQPYEILCLTYTDEATNAMRRRLVQLIGADAHRVNIYTFHGFCNNIIQNNPYYFSFIGGESQPISDLENINILRSILDELPQGHVLRRLSGNLYFDHSRLKSLFDVMRKENWRPETVSVAIDAYLADLPKREKFIYKKAGKGFKSGDVKQNLLDEEHKRMEGTRAAAFLFDDFRNALQQAHRYDFNDMILWVLEAFAAQPALLQSYQERYQFILADEFQDTNGSQNELLNCLTSYWDDPNIFVVGDDDQGIYEFQGARIQNIMDFYRAYKDKIKVIVLSQNYRSSQSILDWAMQSIANNEERLVKQITDFNLEKNIVSAGSRFLLPENVVPPVVTVYDNVFQEEADIVAQIEQLQQSGVALGEVAVLYAQHKQAERIIAALERKGIPYNTKKKVNILNEPLVEQLLKILQYIDAEMRRVFSGEEMLFELLHAPFFEIAVADIARIAVFMTAHRDDKAIQKWKVMLGREEMLSQMELQSLPAIMRVQALLADWEQQQLMLSLPQLLEKIVYESGVVAYLLQQPDHLWNLQILNTFFEFVKSEAARSPKLKIKNFLAILDIMMEEKLSIDLQKVAQHANGVHFYTAHSAKGNEFEYVFLIGCTKQFWERKRGKTNNFKLPDTLTKTVEDAAETDKTETARRLFFVALTRAKKYLNISYALNDSEKGKPQECSLFVDEISAPTDRIQKVLGEGTIVDQAVTSMLVPPEINVRIANGEWVDAVLQQFTMSASSLSKYLKCPLQFYYEEVLRVPTVDNAAMAFGTAVHFALERLFQEMKSREGTFPDKANIIEYFKQSLVRAKTSFTDVQFERRLEQGVTILGAYYDAHIEGFHKDVEIEYKIPRYVYQGVPITGKIDKIEFHENGCHVVDYKTGTPGKYAQAKIAQPNPDAPNGGDYWRQMIFYKILVDNYKDKPWAMKEGRFEFIEPQEDGAFKRVFVPLYIKDEETVLAQLKDSYSKIMAREFSRGCGEPTCRWCNFAKRYNLVEIEEEDI
jgi:DNA helicase II / ATP-dependent DNA helicase PcrA